MPRITSVLLSFVLIGGVLFGTVTAAQASGPALPSTNPANTGMVDLPGSAPGDNTVAVRTIAQAGNIVWLGGLFSEIDDVNGNKVATASDLAPLDASTGLLVPGVHIPLVTFSTGTAEVFDSSLAPNGMLYFAGNFDEVDGFTRHGVAEIDPSTGVLQPFAPNAGNANSILATPDAIYVGTTRLLSFQPNSQPNGQWSSTPGYTPPVAAIDAGRGHDTFPAFRDIAKLGNTLVAACQCDRVTYGQTGQTAFTKAIVEVDATTGNLVTVGGQPWGPSDFTNPDGSENPSFAFGISVIIHDAPGTNTPTIYLAAGGNDWVAAYDFATGQRLWHEDTSGSSQAITWYQGELIDGGHFNWTQEPGQNAPMCGSNDAPNAGCYFSPKLVAMDPSTGEVILNASNQPWNPATCCKYNGVWALQPGNAGSTPTLNVGGEFTQAGGTWTCSSPQYSSTCLSGQVLQKYYARFDGASATSATLTVADAGSGSGTVTDGSGAINCGISCTTDFPANTPVTLTETPTGNSTFTGWSSADPSVSANCPGVPVNCTVTMSQARSVTATFAPISFQLTVSTSGTGTGTMTSTPFGINACSSCSAFFVQNTRVSLVSAPGANSVFSGWGGACSGTGGCQVTMSQAQNVTATFTSTTHTLTLNKTGAGSGTVTSPLPAPRINCGSNCATNTATFSAPSVTLTAVAPGGSAFAGWSSSDPGFSCPGTGTCTVSMDMNRTVVGDFEKARSLGVTVSGGGGGTVTSAPAGVSCGTGTTGTCTEALVQGSTITLTATPDANSLFSTWGGDAAACGASTTCQLTMSAGRSVSATFIAAQTLTVMPAGTGTGTITSSASPPSGTINCGITCKANFVPGASVTLQAVADLTSSSFTGWSGGGCSGTGTCVVTMSSAVTVTATFTPLQRQLTVSVTGDGIVTSNPGSISCAAGSTGTCVTTFQHGTDVELDADAVVPNPYPNSTFTGWEGACTGTDPTCVVEMDQAQSVTATFAPIVDTAQVGLDGFGTGEVTSDTGGIDCPGTCSAAYNQGQHVQLTAIPDPGMVFSGWTGDCSGIGGCSLTVDGQKSVVADFEPQHTLTVGPSGSGSVTSDIGGIDCPSVSCSATYTLGATVTLTAHAGVGAVFNSWGGDCSGTDPTCVVSMNSVKTVSADFEPAQTLSVSTEGSGSGTITSAPARINCTNNGGTCSAQFSQNSMVTLTATPGTNSVLTGWSGGDCDGLNTSSCLVTLSGDESVSANFAPTHVLSVQTAGGTAGSVTSDIGSISCPSVCSDSYQEGTVVALTESSGPNAAFTGWSGIGVNCPSAPTSCQVTLGTDTTVTAAFTAITDPVNVTVNGAGSGLVASSPSGISCSAGLCSASFNQGSQVTLTEAPNTGSAFNGWSGDCSGAATTCQAPVTSSGVNVTATFGLSPQQLNVNIVGTGTLTSNPAGINCATGNTGACGAIYSHGTMVTLTESAGTGFSFGGWGGTGVSCPGTPTTCAVTMNADTTVTATFTQNPSLNLTFAGSGGGSVVSSPSGISCSTNCSASFAPNTLVTLTETPAARSTFGGWSGDCSGTGTCQVTMSAAHNVTATFNGSTTTIDDTNPAVAYNGWAGRLDASANGGSYRVSPVFKDKATWNSPATTSFTFVYHQGPNMGKMSVTVDGGAAVTIDGYSASPGQATRSFTGLPNKAHTVVVKVLNTKNAASSSLGASIDAFVVGSTTFQEADPTIQYDTWKSITNAAAVKNAYNKSYRTASTSAATATVTFTGTGIDWLAGTGSSYGKASVTIDGVSKGTVDLYTPATHWTIVGSYLGLSAGPHTMVIQVLGQKNASSSGTKVLIDGYTIHS